MVGGVGPSDAELEAAAQLALHSYLLDEGFSDPVVPRTGGLIFRRGEVMVRLLRRPRDLAHAFDVHVSVGQRRSADIVDWVRISRLSAEGSIAHACWQWELPELPTLAAALERLRDDVLDPHVAPFWRDPTRLEPVFTALAREREERFRADVQRQSLRPPRETLSADRLPENGGPDDGDTAGE